MSPSRSKRITFNWVSPRVTPTQPNPTVLVVDDERVIADTLATILRSEGFVATAVYSRNAAIQNARESPPDALVCDMVLGAESGIETAVQIKTIRPDCRIILTSWVLNSAETLKQASAQGHEFEVLAKPFHPSIQLDKLRGLTFVQTTEAVRKRTAAKAA